ncbi:hypothetical protein PMAYCL1PPCAC_27997, partial [Pristionchus mayeri]
MLTRERKYIDNADMKKFNGEKGLIITSIVSYAFYMLYFANNSIARYFDVMLCGFAQWFFLGLTSITPFWFVRQAFFECLILFTPSVRRMVFVRKEDETSIVDCVVYLFAFQFASYPFMTGFYELLMDRGLV